jgi:death on curing protein
VRFLTVTEVIAINKDVLGGEAPLDFGPLESAILRPQSIVGGIDAYPDIHSKAAALLYSLVRNHPFMDGNKRTAVLATLIFYGRNFLWLNAAQEDVVGLALDVAEGILDVQGIAGRLKGWVTALEVEEPPED